MRGTRSAVEIGLVEIGLVEVGLVEVGLVEIGLVEIGLEEGRESNGDEVGSSGGGRVQPCRVLGHSPAATAAVYAAPR